MLRIDDRFDGAALNAPWTPLELGGGRVSLGPGGLELGLPALDGQAYADAQITDYAGRARPDFPWRPPLRLTVRAQASGPGESLVGTAGFGFWNDPYLPGRRELPCPPRAVWFFFGAPPNDQRLALDQPGHGWKAATFDASRPLFWALLPLALPGFLLMRVPAAYRALWPLGQRALGVTEAALPGELLAAEHTYRIDWRPGGVTFDVDDATILETDRSPGGPLGFIAWIDNQYAIVTPQGRFGWGVTPGAAQSLRLAQVAIEPLDA